MKRPAVNRRLGVVAVCAVGLALTGGVASAAPDPGGASSPHPTVTRTTGTFQPVGTDGTAVTYDEDLVPPGSRATVLVRPNSAGTMTLLIVQGLESNREYGAHAHVNSCGPTGDAAGPHFQKVVDPVQPSVDPAYANPRNEIWLDFTTNSSGNAIVVSTVPWTFGERRAHSVVVHEHHTQNGDGDGTPGAAGARYGCLTVDF